MEAHWYCLGPVAESRTVLDVFARIKVFNFVVSLYDTRNHVRGLVQRELL